MLTEKDINILIACEESQTIANELRALGFNAYSCDIQDCSGGHPEYHLKADALCAFHYLPWDLIISHPPCTYLSKAGATRLYDANHNIYNFDRFNKGLAAREFFLKCLNAPAPFICVENPTPLKVYRLPTPSQVIEPYHFGDAFSKRTCLWTKNLPPLMNSLYVPEHTSYTASVHGSKLRSKTFPGIAKAIAFQYGYYVLDKYNQVYKGGVHH